MSAWGQRAPNPLERSFPQNSLLPLPRGELLPASRIPAQTPHLTGNSPYNYACRPTGVVSRTSSRPPSSTQLILPQPRRPHGRSGQWTKTSSAAPKPPPSRETLMRAGRELYQARESKFRDAFDHITNDIDVRVQEVVEMLCLSMSDADLIDTIFRKCLKCREKPVGTQSIVNSTDRHKLDELFCRWCVMQLCDLCWRFAQLGARTPDLYEAEFKRDYQCGKYCAKCLRRCWICSRHVRPPLNMNARDNLTVEDRLFNRCRANTSANNASRLSAKAYVVSAESAYEERKATLRLIKQLNTYWKDAQCLPYAVKHKLTDDRYAATWRYLRCKTIVPVWLKMLQKLDAQLLPVIDDGRAIEIYRHCLNHNLLPSAVRDRSLLANDGFALKFPRVPSGEEARALFAGKRIVVMGDSIGRHVYRDLIHLLQGNGPLASYPDFSFKGDEQYCNDICVYGAESDFRLFNQNPRNQWKMKGGDWYEHRIFYGPCNITVEYVWVTRVWNAHVEKDLKTLFDPTVYRAKYNLRRAPDVVIFNSALWDLSRYHDHDYTAYQANCERFAHFWGQIAPTAANISATIFINYSTPKPGATVTGDLVADLTTEDYEAAETNQRVRATLRYLNIAMEKLSATRHTLAVAKRAGFVDLYDASEKLKLELYRFADGIHYDPPAVRVFTSLIIGEYLRLSGNDWPLPTASASQSTLKRGADGRPAVAATANDSVRLHWLHKCHDSLSAHTMSFYNIHRYPVEFALREFREWVRKNRSSFSHTTVANLKKLDFFIAADKTRQLMACFPTREMPFIIARLYALLHAMLDDVGRLLLLRYVSMQEQGTIGMQSIFPLYPGKSRVEIKEIKSHCLAELQKVITSALRRARKQPNLVHYGPPNGHYANETFIRTSFVFQIIKQAEYMTPLYRFVRDTSNRIMQEWKKNPEPSDPNADRLAIEYHFKTDTADIFQGGGVVKAISLAQFLSDDTRYESGYDLADLLVNNADQPPGPAPYVPPPAPALAKASRPPLPEELQQLLPRSAQPPRTVPARTIAPTKGAPVIKPAETKSAVVPKPLPKVATSSTPAASKIVPGFVIPMKIKKQIIRNIIKNPERAERAHARPLFGRTVHVDEEGAEYDAGEDESDDDADDLDADQYAITEIRDLRKHKYTESDNKIEYKILWTKYPKLTDWWEPIQSLDGCKKLLDEFMARPEVQDKYQRILVKLAKEAEEEAKNKAEKKRANAAAADIGEELRSSKSDSSVDAVAPEKRSKTVRFSDNLTAGPSGSKSDKFKEKPSHKSIVKQTLVNNEKKPSKAIKKKNDPFIDDSNDEDGDDDIIERDKKRRKKERKKEKRRIKTERHLAKLERREKKEAKKKSAKKGKDQQPSAGDADDVAAAADTKLSASVAHKLAKVPVNVVSATAADAPKLATVKKHLPKQAQRVYSDYWRENSVARGVREQWQLKNIFSFIPRTDLTGSVHERKMPPQSSDAVRSSGIRTVKVAEVAKDAKRPEGGDDAVVAETDDKRRAVDAALVMWHGSQEIDVVEIEFLIQYYRQKLFRALMKVAVMEKAKK